jgi:hypothetical protein
MFEIEIDIAITYTARFAQCLAMANPGITFSEFKNIPGGFSISKASAL